MPRARPRAKRTRVAPRPRPAPGARAVAALEAELLALAQRLSCIAAESDPPATPLRGALEALVGGYARGGPLATALVEAWRPATIDKRAALAVAWAREQLRLAIAEVLEREAKADRLRHDLPRDALAWVVLAGAEAVIHELTETVPDRIDALLSLAAPGTP